MGFKEIEKFNDALLAKQVWRMLKNPESFCHRGFKAHFFLDCSVLEANSSTNRLYAWKSILSARDVVRKGMVWQIGDGKTVSLKEDKWLPDQVYTQQTNLNQPHVFFSAIYILYKIILYITKFTRPYLKIRLVLF